MPLFWLSLAVAILAIVTSTVYATRKGLEAFRAFKVLGRNVTSEIERIEQHLALAAQSGERLDAELAQLRRSRARLNVLTSAIDDVRASIGRVTAVYPRK